jgi:hypothetical protein
MAPNKLRVWLARKPGAFRRVRSRHQGHNNETAAVANPPQNSRCIRATASQHRCSWQCTTSVAPALGARSVSVHVESARGTISPRRPGPVQPDRGYCGYIGPARRAPGRPGRIVPGPTPGGTVHSACQNWTGVFAAGAGAGPRARGHHFASQVVTLKSGCRREEGRDLSLATNAREREGEWPGATVGDERDSDDCEIRGCQMREGGKERRAPLLRRAQQARLGRLKPARLLWPSYPPQPGFTAQPAEAPPGCSAIGWARPSPPAGPGHRRPSAIRRGGADAEPLRGSPLAACRARLPVAGFVKFSRHTETCHSRARLGEVGWVGGCASRRPPDQKKFFNWKPIESVPFHLAGRVGTISPRRPGKPIDS